MNTTRRQFIQRAFLSLPVIGGLSAVSGCSGTRRGGAAGADTRSKATGGTAAGTGTASAGVSTNDVPYPSITGVDLSRGLTDHGLAPVRFGPLAKPAKGQTVRDPDMPEATITRITDVRHDFAQHGAVNVVPVYPTTQAWNCDESLMFLYVQGGSSGFHALYSGQPPYAYIGQLNVNPSDIEQLWWDRVDPHTLYYLSNYSEGATYFSHMVAYNVRTAAIEVVFDFTDKVKKANGWQSGSGSIVRAGYPFFLGSPDNDIWGLGCCGIPDIGGYDAGDVFGFHRGTGQIIKYRGLPPAQARTNFPTPLPSGNGWFYNHENGGNDALDVTDIYDRSGAKIASVPFSSNEHCGSNQNAAGDDYLVGNQYDTAVRGNMIVANLTRRSITTLVGSANGYGYPRTGALTASACWKNAGWCVSGIVGSPYGSRGTNSADSAQVSPVTMLDQEVVIGNVDTGVVRRVCRHRSTGYYTDAPVNNYWAQPNVTLSPSGTRILVQSDWGNADPKHPVVDPNATSDTYVITLPSAR